jgi:hypothetical protein
VATIVVLGELDMSFHGPAAPDDKEYCDRYDEIAEPLLAVVANHDSETLLFKAVVVTVPTALGTARG